MAVKKADKDVKDIEDILGATEVTDDGWTKAGSMDSDAWDFTKNSILEGLYVKKQVQVGPNDSNMYHIENKADNEMYGVWGSTALDAKFGEIPLGSEVKIEYLGEATSEKTGRTYKNFEVLYRPMPMQKA